MDSRAQEVMAQVASIGNSDLRWKDGRAFSLAYYAGPEVQEVADRAYAMYGSANGLNADAFPSGLYDERWHRKHFVGGQGSS
jgi:hypothetical protein